MIATNQQRPKAYVKITEQPASKALRFRYECEGRSAGSIPGVNFTPENKTYPSIEIVGYTGRAVVVVSCVTKDTPYRPHPHNLVGKDGCKKGVCTLEINSETMRAVFNNLGIQCVKKKDIEAALNAREEIRVDPYKTGFAHRSQPSTIDLNSVRLCFQVFIEGDQRGRFTVPLAPVVSDPIFDKKAMSDLVICRLCSCTASVQGNSQIILLCEKVAKEDIAVRFFEEKNGQNIWEAYGDFQHTDVHKQTAISFKTPRYHNQDITEPAKVFIQLRRPSDGVTSEPLPFEFVPLTSDSAHLKRKRQATGGDPMPLLLQQQQKQLQEHHHHQHQQQNEQTKNIEHFNRNCLNAPANVTPIKIEPREGNGALAASTDAQQQQQQQQQHLTHNQFAHTGVNNMQLRGNYNRFALGQEYGQYSQQQQQQYQHQHQPPPVEHFSQTNPFCNWEKFPAAGAVGAAPAIPSNSTNPFSTTGNHHSQWNLTTNNLVTWETMQQQQQQQQQHQQQQHNNYGNATNNIDAPSGRINNINNGNGNNNENCTTVSDLLNNIDQLSRLNPQNQQMLNLNIAISNFSSMSIST